METHQGAEEEVGAQRRIRGFEEEEEEEEDAALMGGKQLIARRSQEVVGRLIGAREGAALRRVSYEACSVSLASYLASDKAAPLRQVGIDQMSAVLKAGLYPKP
jgi:hypothetical protein